MEGREKLNLTVYLGDDDYFERSTKPVLDALIKHTMEKRGISEEEALSNVLDLAVYEWGILELGQEKVDNLVMDFVKKKTVANEADDLPEHGM